MAKNSTTTRTMTAAGGAGAAAAIFLLPDPLDVASALAALVLAVAFIWLRVDAADEPTGPTAPTPPGRQQHRHRIARMRRRATWLTLAAFAVGASLIAVSVPQS